ncbi:hypothetical protein I5E68_09770 [Novosphingobium sp. YJ-S2-02]|uniref:Uncharacterized protein n=1 Tax=Novosphingobium aureum TaxID=2792964 RepID=A0A931HBZ3_9SPHN|nr:hypothetical protein [Novosphingobium aureum]MBH0113232.1 hypothetical protein [Novosphingobium aureum]
MTTSDAAPYRAGTTSSCLRLAAGASAEALRAAHRTKMANKKLARGFVQVGFTPVRHARIDAAIYTQMSANVAMGQAPFEAEMQARAIIAGKLPERRRDYYTLPRPSKSDDAAYRRGNR